MKHYITKKILIWLLLAIFATPVVIDGLCLLGFSRAWQYLYNGCFFFMILPLLVFAALKDKIQYE